MTMGWQPAARAARRVTRPIGPAPLPVSTCGIEYIRLKEDGRGKGHGR